jgi:hypothetical protein
VWPGTGTGAGIYVNTTQGTPFYTPDFSQPAFREAAVTSTGGRLTWQAAPKHKITAFADLQSFQVWGIGENVAGRKRAGISILPWCCKAPGVRH